MQSHIGWHAMFVFPLSKCSYFQMLALDNNLKNGRSFDGSSTRNSKGYY